MEVLMTGCEGKTRTGSANQRVAQYSCPYCQRLYVSLTCFRKHLAAHAPSLLPPPPPAASSCVVKPRADCSAPSDFCDIFTEEDWMQTESYLCLSSSPNISLLHSILYEGASTELL
uniref:C2H2-type domain-containing protein n=1 Tax=Mesocestoides corti TaxID=53468 RepID=A0A5K3ESR9_MESCO